MTVIVLIVFDSNYTFLYVSKVLRAVLHVWLKVQRWMSLSFRLLHARSLAVSLPSREELAPARLPLLADRRSRASYWSFSSGFYAYVTIAGLRCLHLFVVVLHGAGIFVAGY